MLQGLTNVCREWHLGYCRVKVHNVRWGLLCMKMSIDSLGWVGWGGVGGEWQLVTCMLHNQQPIYLSLVVTMVTSHVLRTLSMYGAS